MIAVKANKDPAFILAAWCGTADAMDRFADAWGSVLAQLRFLGHATPEIRGCGVYVVNAASTMSTCGNRGLKKSLFTMWVAD